jgi:hypothetical protein
VRRRVALTSLFDDFNAAGRQPKTVVLRLGREPVDADAARSRLRLRGHPSVPALSSVRLSLRSGHRL